MRLRLDQGLPRTTPAHLLKLGLEAQHAGDIGLATASDKAILAHSREYGLTVVTLDADFHALLALSGAAGPSVIRIRIEGLKASELAELLMRVVEQCKDDLSSGAMVAATESGVRLRHLPLIRLR